MSAHTHFLDHGEKAVALLPAAPGDPVVQMIERLAANPDVDVTKLERLIEMQKDILLVNAKAAFNAAFSRMQSDLPTVDERGRGDKGSSYAELEDIIEAVRPVLGRHGFSLSHRSEFTDKTVKVIGILTHEQGYSRESEFLSAADTSGSKNAIQALGSAVSYGRRYTTKDLLNIATRREDDDGKKSGTAAQPEGFATWMEDMRAASLMGVKALEKAWGNAPKEFKQAIRALDWEELKVVARKAGA